MPTLTSWSYTLSASALTRGLVLALMTYPAQACVGQALGGSSRKVDRMSTQRASSTVASATLKRCLHGGNRYKAVACKWRGKWGRGQLLWLYGSFRAAALTS